MHLWPSTKVRDSFNHAYIKKLEWNLHRMKIQKHQSSTKQSLLDKQQASDADAATAQKSNSVSFVRRRVLQFCSEFLLILSCCYCCFCCGACGEDEDEEH